MSGGRGDLSAGDLLGELRILRQIGRGGMGVVYLARDERLERRVALKVIAPALAADPEFRDRFIAEARSAAAIDHDRVVPVYAAGLAEDDLYMAMRYIEATDMRAVLAAEGPLEPAAAVAVVAEIAAALDAAHAAGFVHRDIKPANILLRGEPANRTSYLTDFGLTKGGDSQAGTLTGTGQWVGTIDYVAPEQIQSDRVDARTDVYALGCVLYEAVAGSVPYAGNDMQKMWGHVNEPFPRLPSSVPGGERLSAVIARATAAQRLPIPSRAQTPADQPTSIERREQPTRRMAAAKGGGGTRTAAIIGGAVVLAAGLLATAVVIAGGGSGDAPSTVTAANAGGSSREVVMPAERTECARAVYVKKRVPGRPYTSCEFAREVASAYYSGVGLTFTAYSPVTGDKYDMTCEGSGPVRCGNGKTAVVYLTQVVKSTPSGDLGDWPGGEWRARAWQDEATQRGLDAGVLYSSNFSSLRPGYWVVFSGSFASSSEAAERARQAQALGYEDSYPRFVSP